MVVFTCAYCGDSVKKSQVDKHYSFHCRGRSPALTCVDCLKDFHGKEHIGHTSCVTEEERYSAKGVVSKPPSEKGKKKQEDWVNFIRTVLDTDVKLDNIAKDLLVVISKDDTVPKKKPKFLNYCMSKFKCRFAPSYFEEAWNFLEEKREEFLNSLTSVEDGNQVKEINSLEDRKRKRIDSNNESSLNAESKIDDRNKYNGENMKKKRKKKQDRNSESSQKDDQEDCEKEKESKRNNKKNKLTLQNGNAHALNSDVDLTVSYVENENDNDEEINEEETEVAGNGERELPDHLSKKQKKEKRKREKYQKQLLEIQNQPFHNISEDKIDNVEVTVKSKKKKKKVQNNGTVDDSQVSVSTVSKKKPKQQGIDDSADINSLNEEEEDDVSVVKPAKFNWEEIVVKLLETKGELPLKRVEKKVINEYMNTGVHIESVEKVIAKFNKKILKMSRVKVKKEIVKLVPL